MVTHAVFEWAAVLTGSQLYLHTQRSSVANVSGPRFAVVVGCLLGAVLGSKLSYLLYQPAAWDAFVAHPFTALSGQSIVGGLLGGWLGVEIAKWFSGVKHSTGDAFIRPILLGLIIGRIGCFIAGQYDETSGLPTTLFWGYDYGDGIKRHPTQLFDIALALVGLALTPALLRLTATRSGLAFKIFMAAYFWFRFWVDFLKPAPTYYFDALSGIQVFSIVGAGIFTAWAIWQARRTA